jgi:hypothetical protein
LLVLYLYTRVGLDELRLTWACVVCRDLSDIREKYQEDPYDIDFVLPEGWADDFATGNEAEYLLMKLFFFHWMRD